MSGRSSWLLVVLVAVLSVGGWQVWNNWDKYTSAFTGLRGPQAELGGRAVSGAVVDLSVDDKSKPPRAMPAPEFGEGLVDEMLPFAVDTPLLEAAVDVPAKKLPVVYIGFGQDATDANTSASVWFGEFLKFQVRAQAAGGKSLLNVVPNSMVLNSLQSQFGPRRMSASFAEYLADARRQGADVVVLPIADEDTSLPRVRLQMVDLASSRSQTWEPGEAITTSMRDVISEAAIDVMKLAGLDEAAIAGSGVREGAPSNETFAGMAFAQPGETSWEYIQALLADDPDCRCLYSYDYGTTSRLQLLNAGLARFPDDARLQISKAYSLAENGSTTSLIRYTSELMRRYPDNVYVYNWLSNRLEGVFEVTNPPRETPDIYVAMIEQTESFAKVYPDMCDLWWNLAYMNKHLGDYARGWRTVDRIPAEQWGVFERQKGIAFEIMDGLANRYTDYAGLQRAYTYYLSGGGYAGNRALRAHVRRVAELDPRAVDAAVHVAASNSIGYGRAMDYLRLIDEALQQHTGDPEAVKKITCAVGKELTRQVGWKEMTNDQAYGTTNPYSARFLDGAGFVYGRGMNLGFEYDRLYYHMVELRGNTGLIEKWKASGQNTMVALDEAKAAHDSGNWTRGAEMAQKALPGLGATDNAHRCRYYIIKCLWKLKRYDESLVAAREGIMKYPREQSFPYMYAIVALEQGEDLETAFDCAWRAVDLGTANPGCNETFEKLRAKLDKPYHPALAAAGM